ncbi:protein spaetzle isoform X1 [Rhagoletis pomonella]|uniref:protein spaetzle isoform X1 n=1 Tax=Rhagoletis pomonella TaxID=28610 RepID=UPI00177FEFAE|nr:protein spaetzle isoform X1 [Rhagoletis pomonella]
MSRTFWPLRPVLPLLLLAYLLLIVSPIAGDSYDFRTIRQKRSTLAYSRSQSGQIMKTAEDLSDKLERIFKVGDSPGLVLFNDTSQPTFKVQRSPDGKLSVVFNDFLIFQTTTSGTPTHNDHNSNDRNISPVKDNGAIIFPDDEIICPERRQGKPYCTEVPNYLEATQLDKISAEKFDKFRPYFKDDLVQPQNVTQRMNSEPLEEYYCSSTSHLIYPKSAETKESKWLLVVQHDEHRQGILVEQCDNEEKPCRFEESLPRHYTSRCKQHFVFRTMIVLVNGEMMEEQVKMPNCCKCVLRNNGAQH